MWQQQIDQKLNYNKRNYPNSLPILKRKKGPVNLLRNLLILISLINSGCGTLYYDIVPERDPELIPYLEEYIDLKYEYTGESEIENVSLFFVELYGNTAGQCRRMGDQYAIGIDHSKWQIMSNCERRILFLHEMGHCDLKRGHVEHESLMQDTIQLSLGFCTNEEPYLEELFLGQNILEIQNHKCNN